MCVALKKVLRLHNKTLEGSGFFGVGGCGVVNTKCVMLIVSAF